MDDVMEIHGVRTRSDKANLRLTQTGTHVYLDLGNTLSANLSPAEARHLARKLYHLARRIEAPALQSAEGATLAKKERG